MKRNIQLLLLLILFSATANAQRYLGIATSNWSGTNGLYLNPANIADSRDKFTIDLVSLNASADQSLGTINSTQLINRYIKGGGDGKDVAITDVFKFSGNPNKTFDMQVPSLEVRGPGAMVSINSKNSIALTTRIRGMNQFSNFSESLYRSIIDPNYSSNGDYNINSKNFNWTAQIWSEVGLTYGVVLLEKGHSQLKMGVTGRYLGGIAYLGVKGTNLDVHYDAAGQSLSMANSDIEYASNVVKADDQLANGLSNADIVNRFFGSKGGTGFGGDIGLVYEYRTDTTAFTYDMDGKEGLIDHGRNKYKFRISAAITDMGAINYTSSNSFSAKVTGNGTVNGSDLNTNINNFNDFTNYIKTKSFNVDTSKTTTKVHMPTALVIGFDYHIYKHFFANATYIGNLVDRTQFGNSVYDQITVTPRYDRRAYSIGLPITYNMVSSSMKVGIGFRIAGFYFGSDDLLALASDNQTGLNLYVGGYVPITKHKPRDRDHDHVSDRKDKCPNEPGEWDNLGCPNPDKDNDGIMDSVDKCPLVPGSPTASGCPDADLDSVADDYDRCPSEAGSVAMSGCPDRDHDGVADIDDVCPDKPGTAAMDGCPDTDGDGVPDNKDECPDKAGVAALNGCPDTDGDGVPDNKDACPTVAGPESNKGCPIIKKEIRTEVKKRLAFAATGIQFETGKAVIKKTSYSLLNDIVGILNEYTDYSMTIDGYTDNVGKPDKNLTLSRERANAVKNYIVSQGVNTSRIITDGHGEANPVASNKTAKGRAQNRRVALDLVLTNGK